MRRILLSIGLSLISVFAQAGQVASCDATIIDHHRDEREIPVRIRLPEGNAKVAVILFSHGLGGSLDSGTDWLDAWAKAGFMTVTIQHAGSDEAIWKGTRHPLLAARGVMNSTQLQARVDDVHAVLDQLAKGAQIGTCDVHRADMTAVGMSGHSFGAQTTLAIAGGRYANVSASFDPRIKAAIAFSPQPSKGVDDRDAFGQIAMPFFTVTGTRDSFAMFGGVSVADRLRPYQAMPGGDKFYLIVPGATHLMLNGQTLPRANATPTPEMVGDIDEITTLFWKATLLQDKAAAAQLRHFSTAQDPVAGVHQK